MTSRLGTGKSRNFFYSVAKSKEYRAPLCRFCGLCYPRVCSETPFETSPFCQVRSLRYSSLTLKVPKWEIFDRSDFHDFYTIKPLWVGDFGVQYKLVTLNFGAQASFNFCFCFCIFFWRARVCRPLLRLCRPFMIFEGCLDSNPERCRCKLARYRLSHPSL